MDMQSGKITSIDMSVSDIRNALQFKLFYLALIGSLALIDLCAALEDVNGRTGRRKFEAWYATNLFKKYPYLQPEDCYGLRSGLIHQGVAQAHAQNHQSQWDRIIFTLPVAVNIVVQNAVATNLSTSAPLFSTSLEKFCLDVIEAVNSWRIANENNQTVKANIEKLLRFYPQGIPAFRGLPMIT